MSEFGEVGYGVFWERKNLWKFFASETWKNCWNQSCTTIDDDDE